MRNVGALIVGVVVIAAIMGPWLVPFDPAAQELALRLEAIGVADNDKAIGTRVSRGKFAFTFFLQCMRALGTESVDLAERPRRP